MAVEISPGGGGGMLVCWTSNAVWGRFLFLHFVSEVKTVWKSTNTDSVEPAAASPPACEWVTVLVLLIRQPQRAGQPQWRENPWNFGVGLCFRHCRPTYSLPLFSHIVFILVVEELCCRLINITYLSDCFYSFFFLTSITKHLQYSCISIFSQHPDTHLELMLPLRLISYICCSEPSIMR